MGGLPAEKKRSLIFGALRNIAVSKAGVEGGAVTGARAGAAALAAESGGLRSLTETLALDADIVSRT